MKAVREAAGGEVAVVEVGTDEWRRLTVGSTPPPDFETDPESLAVLIYTAGTSGTPGSDADAPCTAGKPRPVDEGH